MAMDNATRIYQAPDDEEESATSLLVPLSVVPPPSKRVKVHVQSIYTTSNANDGRSLRISVDPIAAVARKTLHTNTDHDNNTPKEESSINGPETLTLARNDARNTDATMSNVSYPSYISLSDFNTDILCRITSFLDPASLLMGLGITNCLFHWLCQQNRAGWDDLCEQLWETKCHVAAPARRETNKLRAYRMALEDAHSRHWITEEELCYDGSSNSNNNIQPTIWSFRFKESAGTDWTGVDPWYRGQPCRKLAFFRNGTVREVVQQPQLSPVITTSINNNNSTTAETTTTTTTASATSSNSSTNIEDSAPIQWTDPPLRTTWRFLTRPMDLSQRPHGSYVRFNVGGRDVPTYAVRRSPTGNWGFVLESCWGVYASFELPPRQPTPVIRRRRHGPGTGEELEWVDEEEEETGPSQRREADLQDDTMRLTNEVQWREAFLYNVGARLLPEGDQAADAFDRAWHA